MNPIEALRDRIRDEYPDALLRLTKPIIESGVWSLEVDVADNHLDVEWSNTVGFGVSTTRDDGYADGSDETFPNLEGVSRRVSQILATGERTIPCFGILISRLREGSGVTQKELARKMSVSQATISGIERRNDIQLSTLRRVISALHGTLEIFVRFKNERYRIDVPFLNGHVFKMNGRNDRSGFRNKLSAPGFSNLEREGSLDRSLEIAARVKQRRTLIEFVN